METKLCRKCGEEKLLNADNFYRSKARKSGYVSLCKICRKTYKRANESRSSQKDTLRIQASNESFIRRKLTDGRSHDRAAGRDNDLDLPYLLELFHAQKGKCNMTGHPLDHKYGSPFALSIDRIDNSLGHVKGNVQFIAHCVQNLKNDFTEEQARNAIAAIVFYAKRKGNL